MVDVNGSDTHPLFKFLKAERPGCISWNFSKFIVSKSGHQVERFNHRILFSAIENEIKTMIWSETSTTYVWMKEGKINKRKHLRKHLNAHAYLTLTCFQKLKSYFSTWQPLRKLRHRQVKNTLKFKPSPDEAPSKKFSVMNKNPPSKNKFRLPSATKIHPSDAWSDFPFKDFRCLFSSWFSSSCCRARSKSTRLALFKIIGFELPFIYGHLNLLLSLSRCFQAIKI